MTFRPSTPKVLFFLLIAAQETTPQTPAAITLTPTASPSAGQPGITTISVTGSNFPSGTINTASVSVTVRPVSVGPPSGTTAATAVATVGGSTRRVTFTIPASIAVMTPTPYLVSISGETTAGTMFASSNTASLTINPGPAISGVAPSSGTSGQTLSVTITGSLTSFVQDATKANFGAGISVGGAAAGGLAPVTVTSPTNATAQITISPTATLGPRTVVVQTGVQQAQQPSGFTVIAPTPQITDFNPKSAAPGTLVIITGANLTASQSATPTVTLAKLSGGTIATTVLSANPGSIGFVVPAGAATGLIAVSAGGQNAVSAAALTISGSATFSLSAAPGAVTLIQGQSAVLAVQMTSATDFEAPATLSVAGVPNGVTASFNPPIITAGQSSVMTLKAPINQAVGLSTVTVSASSLVNTISLSQSASAQLTVSPPTTSFIGRTVISDASETPLAGVGIKMLGTDGNGNTTGCSSSTTSDAAGNFALTNLPSNCIGLQLIGYDGTTATSPAGKYAGVNLVYTLVAGQVTPSSVLVHLPRVDNTETFQVQQNSAADQSYSFQTIPGLELTVYAHTTFTMPDGTQPDPFPLAAVHVAVDRLPDFKPPVPTMINVYIIAFQPANVTTNQPVAVTYPNPLNSPSGTDMPLLTLDPTRGKMVPYGTGTVSADGTQIVPDPDPGSPGHRFGIIHFDWHGPMPAPPPQNNPAPPGNGGGDPWPGGGNPPGGNDNGDNNDDDGGGTPVRTSGPPSSCDPSVQCCVPPAQQSASAAWNRESRHASDDLDGLGLLASAFPENQRTANPLGTDRAEAGDPVDLASGIQTLRHRDLLIQGSRGTLSLERTYRSMTTAAGPFGIGTNHNFNYGLDTAFPTLSRAINLIMPDGNRFLFTLHSCPAVIVAGLGPFPCTSGLTNSNIPALMGAALIVHGDDTSDLRWKDGTVYHFVPIGFQAGSLLASITDRNGNTITITRDGSANVTSVTDPVGRSLNLSYDPSGRVTSVTDPTGRTTRYTYNTQGSLDTFTNPVGGVTHYAYDANNNLIQVTDPRGIVQIQNTLDSSGRVTKQVRPDGGTLTFAYTLANPLVPVTPVLGTIISDSQGVTAGYRFNVNGYVTDVTSTQGQTTHIALQDGTNIRSNVVVASAITTYTYDPNGNILTITDPTGRTTTFTYEYTFNNITSITDPAGNKTTYAYDALGNLTSVTDANGNTTASQYDANGLLTQITDPLKAVTSFAYSASGDLISVTDPLNRTTKHAYDPLSRLTLTIDPLNRRTTATYDALGHQLTSKDAKGGSRRLIMTRTAT